MVETTYSHIELNDVLLWSYGSNFIVIKFSNLFKFI